MKTLIVLCAALLLAGGTFLGSPADAQPNRTQVWVGCELFGSIVISNTLPPHGNFDELYAGGNYKDGVGLISDAGPGHGQYNGGRWHLNVLKDGVNPDKYNDACSVEDLDLNDFESTDTYFSCPLTPRRGDR
jgi:hypothetical protein